MTPETELERLLTVAELAKRWQTSERTVTRVIKRGDLPHVRIGRQIRLRRSDVMAYEKNKRS
jgi:excisionase family DNA binding protein